MQGFHPEFRCETTGKEDKAQGQECNPVAGWTSFLRSETSPTPDLVADRDDVVLSAVQTKQYGTPRVLQELQSSLVQSMGEAEAPFKKQERQGYLLSRRSSSRASRGERGLECFSIESTMDTNHALQSGARQERGDDSWSWVQCAQRTTSSPTSTSEQHRHGFDCGGGKDFRKPERVARGGFGAFHGHAAETRNSSCQASSWSQKPLTHGHLNRLNKVKSQLTNAAKRIEELDQEWSSFVQKTMEKVKQHAAMYQSCRADLLEAYNTKLEELSMLKKEMTEASLSMLAPAVTVAPMEKSVDVEKQIHSLEEVIDIESVVGAVDLTDDMDDEVPMGGEALQPASVCPRIPSLFVGRHLQQR